MAVFFEHAGELSDVAGERTQLGLVGLAHTVGRPSVSRLGLLAKLRCPGYLGEHGPNSLP